MSDYFERADKIRQRFDARASKYAEASIKMSMLIITNLILVNAGGLLALANDVAGLAGSTGNVRVVPAVSFLAGLACAVLCAYVAYLNYMWHSLQQTYFSNIDVEYEIQRAYRLIAAERKVSLSEIGVFDGDKSAQTMIDDSSERVKGNEEEAANFRTRINVAFFASQALGVLSGAAFAAACLSLLNEVSAASFV